ncbi:MAG TPA: ABC transporter permease subunit [Erysipelothrix sp.]|nr:ABC transporter permease subunit [Erysipelothrix sp.]
MEDLLDGGARKSSFFDKMKKQKTLIFMSLPFVIWIIVFCYAPLVGWLMAFQEYKPNLGIFEQEFVGLLHFKKLFQDPLFYRSMKNTLGMGILGLIFGFLTSIVFALFLNEMRFTKMKRLTQTISYLPHFVSWVIVANIVRTSLAPSGIVNTLLINFKFIESPIMFFNETKYFWWIVTFSDVWKETGWNAIIYLAAMTSIDQSMYEAAKVDGATRLQQMWNITLPAIKPVISILLIMNIGNLINIGFEKQMLLGNNVIKDATLVLDKYALDYGIGLFKYSYGTAIGIFKSVVSIILVFTFNQIAKKTGQGQLI